MKRSEKQYAIELIDELRGGAVGDARQEQIVAQLDRLLPDPNYWNYLIDHSPKLTAEQVVDRAFNYRPIQL